MSSIEDKITQAIKFEIGDFADKCFEEYKTKIDESVKGVIQETYMDFHARIQSEIKNKIMQTMGPKAMFDYSNIDTPKLWLNLDGKNVFLPLKGFLKHVISGAMNEMKMKAKNGFQCLIPGEKIVIFNEGQCADASIFSKGGFIITNYARCLGFAYGSNNLPYLLGYYEFDFWIPIDYIQVIRGLLMPFDQTRTRFGYFTISERESISVPFRNLQVLAVIKNQLYNRDFVPLYSQQMVLENIALKEKYSRYEADLAALNKARKEFEQERAHFNEHIKPYVNLDKERCELEEKRDKLQRIAKKVILEREAVEKEKKLISSIDLNNI